MTPRTEDTPSEDGPWYRDGLRFECTQCGNCCTGTPGVVWVDDEEIAAIAEFLDKPVGEIRLMNCRRVAGRVSLNEYANGDCVYFDPVNRGCTIYPVRPKQCRTWPFWDSIIENEKDWKSIQPGCPGAGCGKLYSLEEIRKRADVIEM